MGEFNQQIRSVEFPDLAKETISQDEEYFLVQERGKEGKRRIRFHDYHEIYSIPGLYEFLFYEKLKCQSPQLVSELMTRELEHSALEPEQLVVLDVGAGNGMVGEQLTKIGVRSLVGVDIIEEAAEAVERDRPDVYDDYYVADLTCLADPTRQALSEKHFNCLVTVSALGFGDIPPLAFAEAYNLVSTPGLVAFNIKDKFVAAEDSSGFSELIEQITEAGVFEPGSEQRYRHRLSVTGEPLYYVAMVGEKKADIPGEILQAFA
jgi:predicted TPR repeat methyltransferase